MHNGGADAPCRKPVHEGARAINRIDDEEGLAGEARRIVDKVGSSSLTKPGGGVDVERVTQLVDVVADRLGAGSQVILVSSGAIATGFPILGLSRRPRDLATQQASASVGQGVLLAQYSLSFAARDITVGQVLLTADDMTRRAHYRNAQRTLEKLIEMGVVPIVNENDTVATDEIRLGDNDRLAALVAHLVHADALVLLSDVDGLYDGPPGKGEARLSGFKICALCAIIDLQQQRPFFDALIRSKRNFTHNACRFCRQIHPLPRERGANGFNARLPGNRLNSGGRNGHGRRCHRRKKASDHFIAEQVKSD